MQSNPLPGYPERQHVESAAILLGCLLIGAVIVISAIIFG